MQDIVDRLRELVKQLLFRLQESALYSQVEERFFALSLRGQRLVVWGLAVTLLLVVGSVPYAFYQDARARFTVVQQDRQLLNHLFKAAQVPSAFSVPQFGAGELVERISALLQTELLAPQQVQGVGVAQGRSPRLQGVSVVAQEVVELKLAGLNVSQVVKLAEQVESLSPSVKLAGLHMEPSALTEAQGSAGYFDVVFHFAAAKFPETKPLAQAVAEGATQPAAPSGAPGGDAGAPATPPAVPEAPSADAPDTGGV